MSDWIEHDGKGKPSGLDDHTDVVVRQRNGVRSPAMAAFVWHWRHSSKPHPSDIVAYRIHALSPGAAA